MGNRQIAQDPRIFDIPVTMMKLAVLAAMAGSAAAFAPAPVGKTSTSLNAYENEIGALPPVGFWDPAGLSDGISQEKFDEYRLAELKHGRVAQLAVLGYVAPRRTVSATTSRRMARSTRMTCPMAL